MLPVSTDGAVPPAIAARSFWVMLSTWSGLTWKSSWLSLKTRATSLRAWMPVMPPQPNHHSMTGLPDLIGTEARGFGVGVGPAAPPACGAAAVGEAAGAAPPDAACWGAAVGAGAPPPQAVTRSVTAAAEPKSLRTSRRRSTSPFIACLLHARRITRRPPSSSRPDRAGRTACRVFTALYPRHHPTRRQRENGHKAVMGLTKRGARAPVV